MAKKTPAKVEAKPVVEQDDDAFHRLPSEQDQRDMTDDAKRMHTNLKAADSMERIGVGADPDMKYVEKYVMGTVSQDFDVSGSNPDGTMTLSDVHAILADDYPGYSPVDPRGMADGLLFTLPDGASLKVERKRVKACANMEELRAYVGSLT